MEQIIIESQWVWVVVIIGLWSLPWKGIALWKAAQQKEKWWFIILLITNTVAILEISYIFIFSKKKEINNQKVEEL